MPNFGANKPNHERRGLSSEPSSKPKKRTVDVAGLFENVRFTRPRQDDTSHKRHSFADPIGRPILQAGPDSFFTRYGRILPEQDSPIHQDLTDATEQYCEEVQLDFIERLDVARNALIARMDGLDADGRPIEGAIGLPTEQEIEALESEMHAMIRPLREDWLKLRALNNDDSNEEDSAFEHVNFTDTLANLRQKFATKEIELRQMKDRFREVGKELDTAIKNLLEDGDGAMAEANRTLSNIRKMAGDSLSELAEQSVKEVKMAHAEEKASESKRQGMIQRLLMFSE